MTVHPIPQGGLRRWLLAGASSLAALILAWVLAAVVLTPAGPEPALDATVAVDDSFGTAPAGTPLFSEVLSVTDAAFHQGNWFVLDRRGLRVHRLDGSGSLVGSFGKGGGGPGELQRPSAITPYGDALIVLDGGVLHRFEPDGDFLSERRADLGSCGAGSARDVQSGPKGLLLLVDCRMPGRTGWMVVLQPDDGPSRTLAVRTRDPKTVHLGMTWVVLGVHPPGFVFGLAVDDCLDLYSSEGEERGRVCHQWIERLPLPDEFERQVASVGDLARKSGVRLVRTDRLPPFNQVFPVSGNRLAYQAPVPERIEMFRLVTSGSRGEMVVLPLPPAEGLAVAGNSVLLWWEGLEGTYLSVRSLDVP